MLLREPVTSNALHGNALHSNALHGNAIRILYLHLGLIQGGKALSDLLSKTRTMWV